MNHVKAYAAPSAKAPLVPFQISRRELGDNDVAIDVKYCGVCHSDIHQARNEWDGGIYPMVPGHEIVGTIRAVGANVTQHQVGDNVGVGCFVDSCRVCHPCKQGMQQYCEKGMVQTYNSLEKDGKTPTYGGYSASIVVDENYILKIPANIPMAAAAPLLCAGITTYSPLKHWKIQPGDKVGVIGLGGLGHMAVKLAAAMGAEVTVFSTSTKKEQDAYRFGAKQFVVTKTAHALEKYQTYFNFIINTVSMETPLDDYIKLLQLNGTMVIVGVPEKPIQLNASSLIMHRCGIAGSLIGGIKEIQEMLDFCAEKNLSSDIELIPIQKINEAYERVIKSDVRYRFVIDMQTI